MEGLGFQDEAEEAVDGHCSIGAWEEVEAGAGSSPAWGHTRTGGKKCWTSTTVDDEDSGRMVAEWAGCGTWLAATTTVSLAESERSQRQKGNNTGAGEAPYAFRP